MRKGVVARGTHSMTSERYLFITTSVEPCTCGFTRQVFGAVAGELLQFD